MQENCRRCHYVKMSLNRIVVKWRELGITHATTALLSWHRLPQITHGTQLTIALEFEQTVQ